MNKLKCGKEKGLKREETVRLVKEAINIDVTYYSSVAVSAAQLEVLAMRAHEAGVQSAQGEHQAAAARERAAREAVEDVLRDVASYLGCGGYNADEVNPEVFRAKIMDGIQMAGEQFSAKLVAAEERAKAAIAIMNKVSEWMNKLPVPTTGCTHQMMRLKAAIELLEGGGEQLATPEAAPGITLKTLCATCGTHEISVEVTCHNSSCKAYAQGATVYEGWRHVKARNAGEAGATTWPHPDGFGGGMMGEPE